MIVVTNSPIFGQNLKILREKHGLSLQEMAALLQMEPRDLYALEQGLNFEIDGNSVLILFRSFQFNQERFFDTPLA